MSSKRIYFRRTTPAQRQLLFESWQATGNISQACTVAHVCRQTFYDWLPRFSAAGYAGLLAFASTAPKAPHRIAAAIEADVTALRQAHPAWGKRRIADELSKGNQWVSLVTPNTVRRILQDAGLWPEPVAQGKKKLG